MQRYDFIFYIASDILKKVEKELLFPQILVICMPLGVLREPAFEDPFLLEEHLVDGPEAGKCKAAQNGGDYGMPDKQGSAGA